MQTAMTRRSLPRIFAWPIVFAVMSVAGLVSALLGDGLWDWLSWFALGLPVVVIGLLMVSQAKARRPMRDTVSAPSNAVSVKVSKA